MNFFYSNGSRRRRRLQAARFGDGGHRVGTDRMNDHRNSLRLYVICQPESDKKQQAVENTDCFSADQRVIKILIGVHCGKRGRNANAKIGVRTFVLGLEVVTATGDVITRGKTVRMSSV